MLKMVAGILGPVDVFVKEPVQPMVVHQVHLRRHVPFSHSFEVFSGGRGVAVGPRKVMHHGFETFVHIFAAGKDKKAWYWAPVLTYARDFPALSLGYRLPAFRLAIEVIE